MRTVTYGAAVSLDGLLAGVDGSIDWLHFSDDMRQVMTEYWKDVDAILMGRKTYAVAAGQLSAAVKNAASSQRQAREGRHNHLRFL